MSIMNQVANPARRRRDAVRTSLSAGERLDRQVRSLATISSRVGEMARDVEGLPVGNPGDGLLLRQKLMASHELLLGAHGLARAIQRRPLHRAGNISSFIAGVMASLRTLEGMFDREAAGAPADDDGAGQYQRHRNAAVIELQNKMRELVPGMGGLPFDNSAVAGPAPGTGEGDYGSSRKPGLDADPQEEVWPSSDGSNLTVKDLSESFARKAFGQMASNLIRMGAESDVKWVLGMIMRRSRQRRNPG